MQPSAPIRFVTALCLLASAGLPGQAVQTTTAAGAQGSAAPFAAPWAVTFRHIKDAMDGRLGGVAIEQTRRRRDAGPTSPFTGTLERLLYQPSPSGGDFQLRLLGYEGRTLNATELALAAARFDRRAGFHFRYGSFRVTDAAAAAQTYDLVFLAHARRSLKTGSRRVYRMAVLPRGWDRSAWLLDLDYQTGYPLYSGQYELNTSRGIVLVSELIVTSFSTGVRFPQRTNWWAANMGIERLTTEAAALKKALPATAPVAPSADLPVGYQLASSEVHTDPYKGKRQAVLAYTDGVDHIFVREKAIPVAPRPADDTIAYFDQHGVTQCLFNHRGVEFLVVGRSAEGAVRRLSERLYRRAITVLK